MSHAPSDPVELTSTRPCDEVEALLPLIADGSLDERQDPALFVHLSTCERCQDSLVQHDLTALAVAGAIASAPTAKPARAPIAFPWRNRAAAALLLLAVGGWLLTRSAPQVMPIVAATPTQPVAAAVATPAIPTAPEYFTVQGQPTVEVTSMPGQRPGTRVHLIRRGDQVVVREIVIGGPPSGEAPPAGVLPATYSRYY